VGRSRRAMLVRTVSTKLPPAFRTRWIRGSPPRPCAMFEHVGGETRRRCRRIVRSGIRVFPRSSPGDPFSGTRSGSSRTCPPHEVGPYALDSRMASERSPARRTRGAGRSPASPCITPGGGWRRCSCRRGSLRARAAAERTPCRKWCRCRGVRSGAATGICDGRPRGASKRRRPFTEDIIETAGLFQQDDGAHEDPAGVRSRTN